MSGDDQTSLDPILFCSRCGARIDREGGRGLQPRIALGDRVVCPQCAPAEHKRSGGKGFVVAPSARLSCGYNPEAPSKRPTPVLHLLAGIGLATTTALVVILVWFLVRAAMHEKHPTLLRNAPSTSVKEQP